MAMSSTAFRHTPLADASSQIRILELHPGQDTTDAIVCVLRPVSIDSPPIYDALSYCWGPQNNQQPITVDGMAFMVGQNLLAALKRLRLANMPRNLWIDAICINQGSVTEKKKQIPLMRTIYGRAEKAVIWLGEHDHDTALAFEIIEFLAGPGRDYVERYDEYLPAEEWRLASRTMAGRRKIPVIGMLLSTWEARRAERALASIFTRQYFGRTWVLQEIALSRMARVVCGAHETDWTTIEAAYKTNGRHAWEADENLPAIIDLRARFHRREVGHLETLMELSSTSRASNPRDKVYALLGLVDEDDAVKIHVDIRYEAPTWDVFRRFTSECLRATKTADVLAFARHCRDGPEAENMPSWVRDFDDGEDSTDPRSKDDEMRLSRLHRKHRFSWTYQYWRPSEHQHQYGQGRRHAMHWHGATKLSRAEPAFAGEGGRFLGLQGLLVGSIETVGAVLEPGTAPSMTMSPLENIATAEHLTMVYLSWRALADLDNNRTYPGPFTIETYRDAFFRLLPRISPAVIYNKSIDTAVRQACEAFDGFATTRLAFLAGRSQASLTFWDRLRLLLVWWGFWIRFVFSSGTAWLDSMDLFLQLLGHASARDRCMFRTDRGQIGLAGSDVREGDRVVLLSGAVVPYVIRAAGGSTWLLVSEAYLYGVMGGHAWDPSKLDMVWLE